MVGRSTTDLVVGLKRITGKESTINKRWPRRIAMLTRSGLCVKGDAFQNDHHIEKMTRQAGLVDMSTNFKAFAACENFRALPSNYPRRQVCRGGDG